MPNHSKREQETLSGDLLALVEQGRQPALGALDDTALLALITRLDEARAQAETAEDPDSVKFLRAATRRAQGERRERGLRSPLQAGSSEAAAPAKPARAAQAAKRKAATIARKPAGRKPAEARKTDLRTEPHRMPKRRATPPEAAATDLPPAPPARISPMSDSTIDLETPADQTETRVKAPKAAKTPDEKETAKAARKADKQQAAAAQKDAEKQAKLAEKEVARAERKAARKAEKQVQKDAEKELRRAERKAAAAATKAKDAASAKAERQKGKKDGAGKAKPGKDGPGKEGPGKNRDRKAKADQHDS